MFHYGDEILNIKNSLFVIIFLWRGRQLRWSLTSKPGFWYWLIPGFRTCFFSGKVGQQWFCPQWMTADQFWNMWNLWNLNSRTIVWGYLLSGRKYILVSENKIYEKILWAGCQVVFAYFRLFYIWSFGLGWNKLFFFSLDHLD